METVIIEGEEREEFRTVITAAAVFVVMFVAVVFYAVNKIAFCVWLWWL